VAFGSAARAAGGASARAADTASRGAIFTVSHCHGNRDGQERKVVAGCRILRVVA
jgi:hypothetical protein